MGKHTVNGRHPMALQAELRAKKDFQPAPAPEAPPAPPPPPPASVSSAASSVPSAPPTLTLKERLDALPDEELLKLASTHELATTADRDELISALVTAEVTL